MVVSQFLLSTLPIGKPPSDWNVASLKQVTSKIGSGATPRGGAKVYRSNGISLIRSQNVHDHKFTLEGLAFIGEVEASKLNNVIVESGDVLLNITGDSIARCCLVPDWCLPARVNQHVAILRPTKELNSIYLQKYLTLPQVKEYMLGHDAGGTRRALTKGNIENFLIPLPPLYEQKAIAHILGTLDDKIELNRKMNRTLEAIARAIFKSWFVDFDPVKAKSEGRQPVGMDADTAALFPDSFEPSELGDIPKGWRVIEADKVSEIGIGKTPPRKEKQWFSKNPSDVRWMSIKDLGASQLFISSSSEFLTREAVDKFNIRIIPNNTVVVSFKLTVGRVAITDGEMLSNEAIAHFKLVDPALVSEKYLYFYLKGFNYESLGSTSSIATAINSKIIKKLLVIIPPKPIIECYDHLVQNIFEHIKLIQSQSRYLATIRDTLLPKLMSGEIRVKEAEKIVEEVM